MTTLLTDIPAATDVGYVGRGAPIDKYKSVVKVIVGLFFFGAYE